MIQIDNISDNITVPHSLILLKGVVSPVYNFQTSYICIEIENSSQKDISKWHVIKGRFIAYVHLNIGINILNLSCESVIQRKLRIKYIPPNLPRFIRLIYIVCKNDKNPRIQAPPDADNSVQSACKRIILAAEMIQLFIAETLDSQGLGRKTFLIENDNIGHPVCHVFETALTRSEAQAMSGNELWSYFGCELMNSNFSNKENCKFLAFMSFTEYINPNGVIANNHKEILKMTKGHTALGGGGLALLGSGCMYTWPRNLQEIIPCFTNKTSVDKIHYMDDSAGRGEYWACYSTTLGAACHELGHVFDLGHDPEGIMARGFDDMIYFFTIPELHEIRDKKIIAKYSDVSCAFSDDYSISMHCDNVLKERKFERDKKKVQNNNSDIKDFIPSMIVEYCENNHNTGLSSTSGIRNHFGGAFWDRSSAVILAFHKWMNPVSDEKNVVEINKWRISSRNALRIIQLRNSEGFVLSYQEFLNGLDRFHFNLNQYLKILSDEAHVSIVVEDKHGNISKLQLLCNGDGIAS